MHRGGEEGRKTFRPNFDRSVLIDFQAAKIECHKGESFSRIGLIVTNFKLRAGKVTKVYNGAVTLRT